MKDDGVYLEHPEHPERESLLAWAGGSYDPDAFDPSTVVFDDPLKRWKGPSKVNAADDPPPLSPRFVESRPHERRRVRESLHQQSAQHRKLIGKDRCHGIG